MEQHNKAANAAALSAVVLALRMERPPAKLRSEDNEGPKGCAKAKGENSVTDESADHD